MRLLPALASACALALALAGCGGEDDAMATDPAVAQAGLKEAVASGLRQAGFEAEPGFGLKVHAEHGPNWVDVPLEDSFQRYQEDRSRREELVAEVVQETRRHFERGNSEVTFAEARTTLMPVLKPRFALRRLDPEPAESPFAANLAVIYAIQTEDAFTVVSSADAERWGRPLPELQELALDNLLRQTNEEQELLCEPSGGEELCGWASGDGYDATRMIVPGLRDQIEEEYGEPAVYAVPMENVFVALPLRLAERKNTERLLRTKVERDFATSKAPVSPELFVERRGKLVVFRP